MNNIITCSWNKEITRNVKLTSSPAIRCLCNRSIYSIAIFIQQRQSEKVTHSAVFVIDEYFSCYEATFCSMEMPFSNTILCGVSVIIPFQGITINRLGENNSSAQFCLCRTAYERLREVSFRQYDNRPPARITESLTIRTGIYSGRALIQRKVICSNISKKRICVNTICTRKTMSFRSKIQTIGNCTAICLCSQCIVRTIRNSRVHEDTIANSN